MDNRMKKLSQFFLTFFILINSLLLIGTNVYAANDYSIQNTSTGVYYETLNEAINEVGDNHIISVTSTTENPAILYENIKSTGKSYTLELNGNIIDGSSNGPVFIIEGGTVTVNNGTVQNGYTSKTTVPDVSGSSLGRSNYARGKIYGGGFLIFNEDEGKIANVTLTNMKITNNISPYGAGIFVDQGGTLDIVDSEISHNNGGEEFKTSGGGIYINTYYNAIPTVTIDNTEFSNNEANNGAAIYTRSPLYLNNSTVKENSGADSGSGNYGIIFFSTSNADIEIKNTEIFKNTNTPTIISGQKKSLTMDNVQIFENEAFQTGGYYHTAGGATISNTIIKNNKVISSEQNTYSYSSGGLTICATNLVFSSGAVYDNTNENATGGNDIYKKNNNGTSLKPSIIEASQMEDPNNLEKSFKFYKWQNESTGAFIEASKITTTTGELRLSAVNDPQRDVAEFNNIKYQSLTSAIEAANASQAEVNVIKLIAGETEEDNNIVIPTGEMLIKNNIVIDLNGKSIIRDPAQSVFYLINVYKDATLTFTGQGSFNGTIDIKTGGSLILDSILDQEVVINQPNANPVVKIGNNYKNTGVISIAFTSSNANAKNLKNLNTTSELIEVPIFDDPESRLELDQVVLAGFINSQVQVTRGGENNSQIIAINNPIGTDNVKFVSSTGNDSSNGSYSQPYKTMETALASLGENGGKIFIKGTYTVSYDETWRAEKPGNVTVTRLITNDNRTFNKASLIEVPAGNSLTLENITINGATKNISKNYDSMYSPTKVGTIIKVEKDATLNINEGAILENNRVSYSSTDTTFKENSGGAIWSLGTVNMSGGIIRNCEAFDGGAIYLYEKYASLNLSGGAIQENKAGSSGISIYVSVGKAYTYPAGGAVLITRGATMNMTGGSIINNSASYGGGISVGTPNYTEISYSQGHPEENEFIMTGGLIQGNTSRSNGGGIFIQATYKGKISAGQLLDNYSEGGNFGGGAIYVNGNHTTGNYEPGRLIIENALITENSSIQDGGGLAVCNTGSTLLNSVKASVFSGNTAGPEEQKFRDDLSLTTTDGQNLLNGEYGLTKEGDDDHIALITEDGTSYNWRQARKDGLQGGLISEASLDGPHGKHFYTEREISEYEQSQFATIIKGNYAATRGGAIGSNGQVILGENQYNEPEKQSVSKVWKNQSGDPIDPSENFNQVYIWAFAFKDGELSYYTYNPLYARKGNTSINEWKENVTFNKYDGYTYVFLEDAILKDGTHIWSEPSIENIGLKDVVADIMNKYFEEGTSYIYSSDPNSAYDSTFNTTSDNSFKFTNIVFNNKLAIEKVVSGLYNYQDFETAYDFEIEFEFNGTYSGYYQIGNEETKLITETFNEENNKLRFSLKHGDYIVFTNLPFGTKYKVTELSQYEDFVISFDGVITDNTTGEITQNLYKKVTVTNFMNKEEEPKVTKEETHLNGEILISDQVTTNDDGSLKGPYISIGDIIRYHISWDDIRKNGNEITVTDRLDDGVDFVSASYNNVTLFNENSISNEEENVSISYDRTTHTVTWTLKNISVDLPNFVTLEVRVNDKADLLWNYDKEDPTQVDGNFDAEDITNDHKIVNKAVVVINEKEIVTNEVRNLLEGLFIEKIHVITSIEEIDNNYREEIFEDGGVYDLPKNAFDSEYGMGFTELLDEDTEENDYKKTFTHDYNNTVRYYIKVTNNYEDSLDHVIVMDPVRINSLQTTNDAQTVFYGVAGTVNNMPEVEGRTINNVTVEPVKVNGKYVSDNNVVTFKLTSEWDENWGEANVRVEDALPEDANFIGAYYRNFVTESGSFGLTKNNYDPNLSDENVIKIKGEDEYSDTTISYDGKTVSWEYKIESGDSQDDNVMFLQLEIPNVTEENIEEVSSGTYGGFINNIIDTPYEQEKTNNVKAIFNPDDIDNNGSIDSNEGYLRWEFETLPGTNALKNEETSLSPDGYPANVQIVYFEWDMPDSESVEEFTMWKNTAYVQTMDNLKAYLKENYPEKYAIYEESLKEEINDSETELVNLDNTFSFDSEKLNTDQDINSEDNNSISLFSSLKSSLGMMPVKVLDSSNTNKVTIEDFDEESDIVSFDNSYESEEEIGNTIPNDNDSNAVEDIIANTGFSGDNSTTDHISIYSLFGWRTLRDGMMASNTVREVINSGNLEITKEVEGSNDLSREFTFNIKLDFRNVLSYSEDSQDLDGNFIVYDSDNNVVGQVVNGTGTFTLRSGQTARIENLPLRTEFTITEINNTQYDVTGQIVYPEEAKKDTDVFTGSTSTGEITLNNSVVSVLYVNTLKETEKPPVETEETEKPDEPVDPDEPNEPEEVEKPDEEVKDPEVTDKTESPEKPSDSNDSNNKPSGSQTTLTESPANSENNTTTGTITTTTGTNPAGSASTTSTTSTTSPKTGVNNYLIVFVVLIVIAIISLVVVNKRKNRDQ